MKITPSNNSTWIVKNLKGTTGLTCRCGSWINHWRNYTNSKRAKCSVYGCWNTAKVGAHVRLVDNSTDNRWWIAPFCGSHNSHYCTESLSLKPDVELVSANKSHTCKDLLSKHENFMVKKILISRALTCNCTSPFDHWKNHANSVRVKCAAVGCSLNAEYGTYVKSTDNRTDARPWIVPFCKIHDRSIEKVSINKNVTLISVYKTHFCKSSSVIQH